MAKSNISLKHYEGLRKDGAKWKVLGTFKSIDEAREAGATKCRPRFNRSGKRSR